MLPAMTANRTASAPPTVVRCATAADLLRLVPQLVAVDTRDSVVLVLFRGRRTHGALRVDAPRGVTGERLGAWAARMLGTVCKVEGADGVVPIAFTDDAFAPSGRPPQAEVLRALNRAAERMGLEVRDLLCVAADGWGSLLDPDLPRGGRPLDELAPREGDPERPRRAVPVPLPASEAARDAFVDALARWWTHPEGPGGVLHGVDLRRPGSAFGPAAGQRPAMQRYRWGEDQADVVALIERMLDPHEEEDPDRPCPCRALLYAIGSRQGLENLMLVQFGWGAGLAQRLWRVAHAGDRDSPVLDRLAAAIGGGMIRRPDVDRLERAVAVVTAVSALVEEPVRAPLDGMLSWLHWALGASSVAAALASRALALEPDRDLPLLVAARTRAGELPEWAFREDPTAPDPMAPPA